jgi:hypothetical protein
MDVGGGVDGGKVDEEKENLVEPADGGWHQLGESLKPATTGRRTTARRPKSVAALSSFAYGCGASGMLRARPSFP